MEVKEIISYGCHNGSNQQFAYKKGSKQIIIKSSKKCLDVTKRNRVVQNKCNRGTAIEERNRVVQKWKYNGKRKEYISMKNKKCLDVAGKKYDNGNVIVYECNKGSNQKFSWR